MGNEFQKNFTEITENMIIKNLLKILIIISKNKIQKKNIETTKKIVIGKNKWKKILNLYVKELIEYEKKQLF